MLVYHRLLRGSILSALWAFFPSFASVSGSGTPFPNLTHPKISRVSRAAYLFTRASL